MIRNDEKKFPHGLILTNTQVPRLCKTFEYGSSADMKLSEIPLNKIWQPESRFLRPLLKTGCHLVRNVLKSSAKSILILLRLTVAASSADAAARRKCLNWIQEH